MEFSLLSYIEKLMKLTKVKYNFMDLRGVEFYLGEMDSTKVKWIPLYRKCEENIVIETGRF